MSAGVQQARAPFEDPVSKPWAGSCRAALSMQPGSFRDVRSLPFHDEVPAIEIAEGASEYRLRVPLASLDPRKLYVFATPHALLIEIRFKSTLCHSTTNAPVRETIEHRIAREFTLPIEIEHGTTTVRVCGQFLDITAPKSQQAQQTSWSELVHFDARPPSDCG
jgi:HSP20 family molecular chaperone IbpA